MKLKYYHVDTFTDKLFGGNPAMVVEIGNWLEDKLLQSIAKENSVDATAFVVRKTNAIELRWFTPDLELDLCGHATLAAAHILLSTHKGNLGAVDFKTKSGYLNVRHEKGLYIMKLPKREPKPATLPDFIRNSLNKQPLEILKSRDYVLVFENEEDVRGVEIDRTEFDKGNIDPGGVAITAQGEKVDFVSRFFIPQATIFEDPVTGSLHASLIPYWSKILNKKELVALQLSKRQGKIWCVNLNDGVLVSGRALTYSEGVISLDENVFQN